MKPKSFLRLFLLAAGSSLLAVSSASAQANLTWDTVTGDGSTITGGTGAWNTTNSLWNSAGTNVTWDNTGTLDDATFSGTAGTVTLGEAISLRNLTFTNAATVYVITGNTLNFTGGTITTPNPSGAGANLGARIESNITGAPNIDAALLGTNEVFTLRPAAGGSQAIGTITGAGGNSAGIINFEGGAGHTSTVVGSSGPTAAGGPKAIFNSSGTWTVTGTILSRNVEINGGTVTVSTGTLSNASSQGRAVFLNGGTLNYNNAAAVQDQNTSFGGTNTDGGDFVIASGTIDQTSGAAITTSTHNPNISLAGTMTFNGSLGALSNLNMGIGRVTLNATRAISVTNAATTFTLGGNIVGTSAVNTDGLGFGLTKTGDGTLLLAGNSMYSGVTTLTAGTLSVSSIGNGALSPTLTTTAGSATVTASSTAGLVVGQTVSSPRIPVGYTIATIVNGTTFTLNSGTGVTAAASQASRIGTMSNLGLATNDAANLVFNGGTLLYTGANATSDRAFTINAGQTATIETANNLSLVGATGTATTGALTKTGAGALTLTGTNTYTGATNVSAGTLAITGTGSINSTSSISVASGATLRHNSSTALSVAPTLNGSGVSNRAVLGGTGPINVAVTLDNLGDVLSPGNSPGIQNYTVGQTWSSFSYDWEVNDFSDVTGLTAGSDFDQFGINGALDLSGGSGSYNLNVLGLTAGNAAGLVPNFSEINRSWTILTTTTGITNFNAANWSINTTGFTDPDTGTWALAQSGNNLVLSYTSVPEPRAALLGGLGLIILLRRRR